jgi:hypothetical protein
MMMKGVNASCGCGSICGVAATQNKARPVARGALFDRSATGLGLAGLILATLLVVADGLLVVLPIVFVAFRLLDSLLVLLAVGLLAVLLVLVGGVRIGLILGHGLIPWGMPADAGIWKGAISMPDAPDCIPAIHRDGRERSSGAHGAVFHDRSGATARHMAASAIEPLQCLSCATRVA